MENCNKEFKSFIHYLHQNGLYPLFWYDYTHHRKGPLSESWEKGRNSLFKDKKHYNGLNNATFLNYAFYWDNSVKGRNFWVEVHSKMRKESGDTLVL